MWLLLVRKLLPPRTKISSVNLLGGREAVEEACRLNQKNTGRRKLFITDGDFDWALGKNKKRLKYLYRLKSYSIEGILISENSLVQIGLETNPKATENQLHNLIAFSDIVQELENKILGLFVCYAVAFELVRRIQTVGYPIGNLYTATQNGPRICPRKVFLRSINVYRAATSEVGLETVQAGRAAVAARATYLALHQMISGKDYLLPYVLVRFKAVCGYNGNIEQFKVALARQYDPSQEPYLARRLRNLRP